MFCHHMDFFKQKWKIMSTSYNPEVSSAALVTLKYTHLEMWTPLYDYCKCLDHVSLSDKYYSLNQRRFLVKSSQDIGVKNDIFP